MGNILNTIHVDISKTLGVAENIMIRAYCSLEEAKIYTFLFKEFHEVFAWSYKEMPRIDPRIVNHEIKTCDNVESI